MRGRKPRINASAFHAWEQLKTPFRGDPHTLDEVVEAILGLPADRTRVERVYKVPVIWHSVTGAAFGCRFRLVARRNPEGRWEEVHEVHYLGPDTGE